MKTYIAHYSPLTARKEFMTQQIKKHNLDSFFIETEDGPGSYVKITPGETSLFKKHIEIWSRIANSEDVYALVLEDDAILSDDFTEKLASYTSQLPPYFDMLFVGNGCNLHMNIEKGNIIRRPNELGVTRCTDSYIITKTCAERLLQHVNGLLDKPVDHWMNKMGNELKLIVFWAEPTIVSQASQTGMFKSALR